MGKTSILKHFGSENYKNTAYFNFDKQPDLKQFFEISKEPTQIIQNLSLVLCFKIEPKQTLIILDEIQECKEALNSLKYFEESDLGYHIVSTGSLLGVMLGNKVSFPVGKVEFLEMYPLSFLEFLREKDAEMAQYI